jgi:hypothetical protein
MFADTIKSSSNATFHNLPETPKLHFCGYSVLKSELALRDTKTDEIADFITHNTSLKEKENLFKMHFSKVKVINDTDKLQQDIKDYYELSTGYDLGLCIDEEKLQSAWMHIDSIVDVSSSFSMSTAILGAIVGVAISRSLDDTKTPYIDILSKSICYSGFAALTKIAYDFVRNVTGSKPMHFHIIKAKKNWERYLSNDAIEKSIKDTSLSQKDSQINKSFFDMSNFPILFDNLYRFLGVSRHQTLALFNATLIGIVDTWSEISCKQLSTDDKVTKIDNDIINKTIIENTLLALELNRLIFHDKQTIDKQTIKPEEKGILIAALQAKNSIDLKNINLESRNKKIIGFTAKKNLFKKNLSDLKQGFYTMNIDTFLALRVTESFKGKVYSLFMPLLNVTYESSSVDDICGLLSNFDQYRNISLDKIGGEIESI